MPKKLLICARCISEVRKVVDHSGSIGFTCCLTTEPRTVATLSTFTGVKAKGIRNSRARMHWLRRVIPFLLEHKLDKLLKSIVAQLKDRDCAESVAEAKTSDTRAIGIAEDRITLNPGEFAILYPTKDIEAVEEWLAANF